MDLLMTGWGQQRASAIGKIVEVLPSPRTESFKWKLVGSSITSLAFVALGIFTGMWTFLVGSLLYTGYRFVVWRRECFYADKYNRLQRLAQASAGLPVTTKNSKNSEGPPSTAAALLSVWEPKWYTDSQRRAS